MTDPVKPNTCTFCQKCPPTKKYTFGSFKNGQQVIIWVCDACYQKTQEH